MKPLQFFKELKTNFSDILYTGLVLNDEIQFDEIKEELDKENHEALIMRLYFLALDPEKEIKYFINQYQEQKYIYIFKIEEGAWLFILSENQSFAKLHFFIQYLLSETKLDLKVEDEAQEDQLTKEVQSAKRIQKLLLPNPENGLKQFKSYSLWYRPKDDVGGDFYWIKKDRDATWIVIGDCTGHSFEGAMASVSVISILNQVYDSKFAPHKLIMEMHKSLDNIQNQNLILGYGIGCEMMVMKFDHINKQLHYSGTGLHLYKMSNNNVRVEKTKKVMLDPNRMLRYLRSRKLSFKEGDAFFTHSDGLIDQFNPLGKRIQSKGLLRYLKLDYTGQKKALELFFDNYRKEEPQTDDIVSLFVTM
ncbi:MAG: SpoIIE family protein phosphatase [Bacteroidota bacterium]